MWGHNPVKTTFPGMNLFHGYCPNGESYAKLSTANVETDRHNRTCQQNYDDYDAT
jgi:hypothetical protein